MADFLRKRARTPLPARMAAAAAGMLCLCLLAAREGRGDDTILWWNDAWSHRQIVEILSPDPSGSINTALVRIESHGAAASDGRDFRVVCPQGTIAPHQITGQDGNTFEIQFHAEPEKLIYQVYYGNPEASAVEREWERKLGGLHLKTLRNDARGPAWNLRQMQQMVEQSGHVFGEGPRPNIDDGYNPFGDDDFYLSVYRGKLYCPEDGTYVFASNSDDSSFLLINGRLVVQIPGGRAPTVTWEHTGQIRLERGIHEIEYYHVEVDGGQLARAGWQPPGVNSIVTIPPRYFVRELITEVIARESRGKTVNAFFSYEEQAGRVFNRDPRVFSPVQFVDRSLSAFGDIMMREWDFGDGSPTSNEESPSHEYTDSGAYKVTLRVWNEYGLADECARIVRLGELRPERIGLYLDLAAEPAILRGFQPVEIDARFKASALEDIPVELRVEALDSAGNILHWSKEATTALKDDWTSRRFEMDYPAVSGGTLATLEYTVIARLLYRGAPIVERRVRVVPASHIFDRLTLTDLGMVDGAGNHVLLRIGHGDRHRGGAFVRDRQKDSLKLLVIDDFLSPYEEPGAGVTHYSILARLLENRYPRVNVTVRRIDSSIFNEYPPLERIGLVPPLAAEAEADIILIAPGVLDLLANLPEDKYEQHLQALAERIISATTGHIVLITPPPMMAQPELSRRYAYATKRVATRLNLPVADAYSAFMLLDQPWQSLFRDSHFADEVYYLWPAYEGQLIIGRRVYQALFPEDSSPPGIQ